MGKDLMQVYLIAAMAHNRVIGANNQIPWHLPEDLQHFKQLTLGDVIVMGRKTYESLGRPLPGRRNVVITRQADLTIPGCEVVHGLEEVYARFKQEKHIWIIGGASLYQAALPVAARLYLTYIDLEVAGDTRFPVWEAKQWQSIATEKHQTDDAQKYAYEFVTLQRIES